MKVDQKLKFFVLPHFIELNEVGIHIQCCSCRKFFQSKSIMHHLARNKNCNLQTTKKEYIRKLTQGYSIDKKRKHELGRDNKEAKKAERR